MSSSKVRVILNACIARFMAMLDSLFVNIAVP